MLVTVSMPANILWVNLSFYIVFDYACQCLLLYYTTLQRDCTRSKISTTSTRKWAERKPTTLTQTCMATQNNYVTTDNPYAHGVTTTKRLFCLSACSLCPAGRRLLKKIIASVARFLLQTSWLVEKVEPESPSDMV